MWCFLFALSIPHKKNIILVKILNFGIDSVTTLTLFTLLVAKLNFCSVVSLCNKPISLSFVAFTVCQYHIKIHNFSKNFKFWY